MQIASIKNVVKMYQAKYNKWDIFWNSIDIILCFYACISYVQAMIPIESWEIIPISKNNWCNQIYNFNEFCGFNEINVSNQKINYFSDSFYECV